MAVVAVLIFFQTVEMSAAIALKRADILHAQIAGIEADGRRALPGSEENEKTRQIRESLFRALVQCNEEARDFGIVSPLLERSLGHTYLRSGDLPRAVLSYRCGLRLAPGDPSLETALAYARSRVEYPPNPILATAMQPAREYWPGWLSLHRLGLAASVAYIVACVAVTRWRMTRRRGWLWLAGVAAVVALVPAVGSGVEWLRRQRDEAAPVVVLARNEVLRMGNGVEYPPRLEAPLPRGAEVHRLFERGGWYQVELSGRVVGWLPGDAVLGD